MKGKKKRKRKKPLQSIIILKPMNLTQLENQLRHQEINNNYLPNKINSKIIEYSFFLVSILLLDFGLIKNWLWRISFISIYEYPNNLVTIALQWLFSTILRFMTMEESLFIKRKDQVNNSPCLCMSYVGKGDGVSTIAVKIAGPKILILRNFWGLIRTIIQNGDGDLNGTARSVIKFQKNFLMFNFQRLNAPEWKNRTTLDDQISRCNSCSYSKAAPGSVIFTRWTPPPKHMFKLNFDPGSLRQQSSAAGFLIRNEDGFLLEATSINVGYCKVYIAEAFGLLQGIKRALDKGIRRLVIEGDNLLIINSVKGKWSPPWSLDHLIKEILFYTHQLEYFEIHHIYREANQAANWIANIGHLLDSSMDIAPQRFSRLSEILRHDADGMIFARKVS